MLLLGMDSLDRADVIGAKICSAYDLAGGEVVLFFVNGFFTN